MEYIGVALMIFLMLGFVAVLLYAFAGKTRSQALEAQKHIIFQEDDSDPADAGKEERKNG